MALAKAHKNIYPGPPLECELVEVDVASVPMMLTALRQRAWKNNWLTLDDQVRGRWAMNRAGARLLMGCSDKIVAAIDRLYMLVDLAEFARVRTLVDDGTGVLVPDPPIPAVPEPLNPYMSGNNYWLELLVAAVENFTQGYDRSAYGYSDTRNIRQQIADLLLALQSGQPPTEQQIALLTKILLSLGGVP